MSIKEISKMLVKARRPIDFFGDVGKKDLTIQYRNYAKLLHPDSGKFTDDNEKYLASEAFVLLHNLYKAGMKEYDDGIYTIIDTVSLYNKSSPLFEINLSNDTYKFYEHYCAGEVADIYKGTNGKYIVYLKKAINPVDNELINNEFEVLSSLSHYSLPIVEKQVMINDTMAFLMGEVKGLSVPNLLKEYSNIPAEHVMWILERLFNIDGYLHSNYIVHGNIKPEHVIVNPENHNVSLLGFSMCIKDANTATAKYKIVNDYYTAPEVNKFTRVLPNTDIYSIGKVALSLLGGDIKSNGMPLNVNQEVRDFIRKLINPDSSLRPNDAWKLWDETIELRSKVFGTERFKKLEKKL